jgi:hypothetical protein
MANRKRTSRTLRLAAWMIAGGIVLQTSCEVAMQDAIVKAGANFVGDYIAAMLARFLPASAA